MNLFLRELKACRRSLILWCLGMLFVVSGSMGKFSGFSASGQSANEMISVIPESVRIVLGFGNFDLSLAIGFYGVVFGYVAIMAAIHATITGATVISKEERDKTAEFLMAKPISRNTVITAKLAAAFMNILVLNLVTYGISYALVDYYSDTVSYAGDIALLMAGLLVLQLIFMLLASAAAAVMKRPKASVSVASGIMLALYLLDKIIDLNRDLDFLKYLTPFKYFNAVNILGDTSFEAVFAILSTVLVGMLLYITFASFRKRDMII